MNLAIDENGNVIFEGSGFYGHALVPTPMVSQANIVPPSDNPTDHAPSGFLTSCKYIFREDSYDPVTRIRRGRFYNFVGTQNWHVLPHPSSFKPSTSQDENRPHSRHCQVFSHTSLWSQFLRQGEDRPLVILGSKNRFTLWRILSIETNIAGEELVVLKGRHSFGALPDIDKEQIPIQRREKVLEFLDKLQEDIFRASPASVVDRARDAAASILRAYLGNNSVLKVDADLDRLVKMVRSMGNLENIGNAGDIVRILHSRAKPSIQEKIPNIRQVHEQDAELAVQCVGVILCDLGWAAWR
ncbi:MAG: hypothetical protein ACYDAI_19525 [Trichloromonadaceae bacterium]